MPPGRGDGPGVLGPDLALPPGLGAHGQLAQGPTQADPAPGDRAGQVTTRGDPAAAVLAPSAAHSSDASKAALASVTKASKRDSARCRVSMEAPSP